jgi:hypothetical protein
MFCIRYALVLCDCGGDPGLPLELLKSTVLGIIANAFNRESQSMYIAAVQAIGNLYIVHNLSHQTHGKCLIT